MTDNIISRAMLKKSIDDWHHWYCRAREKLYPRYHGFEIPKKNALALIGVRRAGKTYTAISLSLKYPLERVLYFNFEDPSIHMNNSVLNLDEIISVYTEYNGREPLLILWDEIHNIDGWEKWVRKIVDTEKYRLILTGSSANFLSSELSSSITGRSIEKKIWPCSFLEFLNFKKKQTTNTLSAHEYLAALREYLKWGGFPEVLLTTSQTQKKDLLKQYLQDAITKDVVTRHEVRIKRHLDQIVTYYLTNISSLHSYNSLKRAFGINVETVSEYTHYLNEAFLVFEVPRYHQNLKVQVRDPKKIYAIDTGLRNTNAVSIHEDSGKLAENIVFVELLRRNLHEVTYFKGKGEVDFVLTQNYIPRHAIQVCFSNLESPNLFKREVDSLVECLNELKLSAGAILTLNRQETIKVEKKKISLMPLYLWLLEQKLNYTQ